MKRIIITTVFAMGLILVGVGSMAAQSSSVAGEWDLDYFQGGYFRNVHAHRLIFEVNGETLDVELNGDCPALNGTIKGNDIIFSCAIGKGPNDPIIFTFTGKVNGDSMSGTVSVTWGGVLRDDFPDTWSAKRDKPKPKP